MITPGTQPDLSFNVKVFSHGKTTEVPFKSLIDSPTLVSVYMRNNTSACDRQTTSLAQHAVDFTKRGWNVVAVSRDTCSSHSKYATKQGIEFTLVSDPEDKVSKALDAIVEKSMYGKKYHGPSRSAYLFDASATLIGIIHKVDAPAHGKQALEAIDAIPR